MNTSRRHARAVAAFTFGLILNGSALKGFAAERTQQFDRDPGWDGHNNRATWVPTREVRQDFGYSPSSHAGGGAGELGGFITPAAEPSYYAVRIPDRTFDQPLTASGKVACTGNEFHV